MTISGNVAPGVKGGGERIKEIKKRGRQEFGIQDYIIKNSGAARECKV